MRAAGVVGETGHVIDVEQRKRPGVAFAGFAAPFALQLAVVAAFRAGYFTDAGWRGGEYAYAFIGVAIGSIVLGCALKFARPPWNSVGTGMVLAGALGFLIVVAVFALFLVALSQWGST
jgi:membrane protease YdiL (CAAX protease family)